MAELHKNQVAWSAPEPTSASFAGKQDYLGKAFHQLGQMAENFAEIKAGIDDVAASEDMNLVSKEALDKLSKYEPSDNNYEPARQDYFKTINDRLNSLPEDARARFIRSNPDYMGKVELAAEEVIFEKQQQFTQKTITLTSPKIQSRVIAGEISYEQGKAQMEEMLKDTNNVFGAQAMYDFDHGITLAKLNNLLMAGQYDKVIEYASHVQASSEDGKKIGIYADTLTPEERISFVKSANDAKQKVLAEQEKAKNSLVESSDITEKVLLSTGLELLERDDNSYVEFLQSLDNPAETVTLYDGRKMSVQDIMPVVRRDVLKKLTTYEDDSRFYQRNAGEVAMRANTLLTQYKKSYIDDTNHSLGVYNQLNSLRNSSDYYYLSDNLKTELDEATIGQDLRLLNAVDTPAETVNYYGLGSSAANVLGSASSGGLLGLTIGSAGGPLGGGVGALIGAAAGAAYGSLPVTEYEDKAALRVLEERLFNTSITTGAVLSPVTNVERKTGRLLNDPQRLYRQATTWARDNVFTGDKEIKYGSAAEFVLNTFVKLFAADSQGRQGRKLVGLETVSNQDLASAANQLLGELQAEGMYDWIMQEHPDASGKVTKYLFDKFFKLAANNENIKFSEQQKTLKDGVYQEIVSATKRGTGMITPSTKTEMAVADEEKMYAPLLEEEYRKKLKKEFE